MKKEALIISIPVLFYCIAVSCNFGTSAKYGQIPTDSATIAKGEATFTQYCSSCHNFKQDGIGPQLGGVTAGAPVEWFRQFIRDPKKMIESGDERAKQLHKKYKATMPSFSTLTNDQLDEIIAFLHTQKKPVQKISKNLGKEITDPIPDLIPLSTLVAEMKLVMQIPASGKNGRIPLARITKLDFAPNIDGLFIVDLRGRLYKLKDSKLTVYMDMAWLRPKFISEPGQATGFGSFAFHPGFAKNGLVYTTHTEHPGSGKSDFSYADSIKVTLQWVLTEWKTDNPASDSFSGTGRELLRVNMPTGMHGFQEIVFNPLARPGDKDYGMLYLGIGDGGSVDAGYPSVPHGLDKIWGTIIRIDPSERNSNNGQYGIPPDNPFVNSTNVKTIKEIYAYGFRNPHRITWSKSGQMLVSNIGQNNIESINLVMPGNDFGWPMREGNFVFDPYGDLNKVYALPANDSIYKFSYPVAGYDHNGAALVAIAGGYEYWGKTISRLKGKFLFGDIHSGRLYYINMTDIKQGKLAPVKEWKVAVNGTPTSLSALCGHERTDMRFGRDAQGEVYIMTKTDGRVYKLVNATIKEEH